MNFFSSFRDRSPYSKHVLMFTLLCIRFFADLLSQSWPSGFWHTMRTFYDGDAYPAMGLYFKFFDVAVSSPVFLLRTPCGR